jgi:trans-aconitate 2-methyltransferase
MSDWDAARYDRLSDPQVEWGRRVIARLEPREGERILDLGCGTGRLTTEIAAMTSPGVVVGLDASAAMLAVAQRAAPVSAGAMRAPLVPLVRGDGTALPFAGVFDAVFSAATLHWIADHPAVFRSVFVALRPGGRFVAQCGGGPNLARLYGRAAEQARTPPWSSFFDGWSDPWHFAAPEPTRQALERAGFAGATAALQAAPVTFAEAGTFSDFIACVCLRHHLQRMPPAAQAGFLARLTDAAAHDDPPLTLDYWRLNIDARRPLA